VLDDEAADIAVHRSHGEPSGATSAAAETTYPHNAWYRPVRWPAATSSSVTPCA
jgi:hypothetical protein